MNSCTIEHDGNRWPRAASRGLHAAALGLLIGGLVATSASPPVAYAQELMTALAPADLVAEAEWVGIATLVDAHSRMNARGNLIVTDYRFREQQSLLGSPPTIDFTLTQGGGTLNGETHQISDAADLAVGQRYLLFVRPGRGEVFAPFVGGAQGAFVFDDDGSIEALDLSHRRVDANIFLDQIRALAAARGSAAPRPARNAVAAPAQAYPAKTYLPLGLTPPAPAAIAAPEIAADPTGAPRTRRDAATATPERLPGYGTSSTQQPSWHYDHRIAPPAVINAFPHDWVWHPFEENQLAYWNQYAGDIFQVYTTPTGTWAWNNGVFDLAGFPSNDDMIAQFGEGWGANALGITYSRWNDDGPTIEADTALNPAQCWTLDDRYGTDDTGACWSFRRTMLHEVGHTWGLRHPWETQAVSWDAVLNYAPHEYRFPSLFLDDTGGARGAFGGLPIHDAGISLYTTSLDSSAGAQSAIYTPTQTGDVTVYHGDDLAATMPNPFKIENTGTDAVVAPAIDFYLTQSRMSWSDTTPYIGSAVASDVPVNFVITYPLPFLPVPSSVPTGTYWFAAYLSNVDAIGANNSAWANEATHVNVRNRPETLFPDTTPRTAFGSLGPGGSWQLVLSAAAGATYELSLCGEDGGSAGFDTTLSVSDASGQLAFDDDSCGTQSRLIWTAPYTGNFQVDVASYHAAYQGTFQLAYVREVVDAVFESGFDG